MSNGRCEVSLGKASKSDGQCLLIGIPSHMSVSDGGHMRLVPRGAITDVALRGRVEAAITG